ncbi:MAG: ABC transporter permease [Negativicutes bacterium]|nr:ABC transporter permease [Negativicutes bacterium]
MKNILKGLPAIFSFTFNQQIRSKTYKLLTIGLAVLCFLIPAVSMTLVAYLNGSESDQLTVSFVRQVYVVDTSNTTKLDYTFLNSLGNAEFANLLYVNYDDLNTANQAAQRSDGSVLILLMEKSAAGFALHLLLPDQTKLTEQDARGFERFFSANFQSVLIQKSSLNLPQILELTTPIAVQIKTESQTPAIEPVATAKTVLSYVLPYLNMMLLYFLILAYGQGVANSVIMEKTSRLMDTFLVAVQPSAMVFGKVFAIALSGLLQLGIWLLSVIGGFACGTFFVQAMHPKASLGIMQLFDSFGAFSGMFTVSGLVVALLVLISGFLLYCALAAIGGAVASKPEDLSSTNQLFILTLVISFFSVFAFSGGFSSGGFTNTAWLNWIPFTAIMIVPSRVLLGQMSLLAAMGSLAVILLTTGLVMLLAGKLYTMMSLYKGNPPSIKKILLILYR